MGKIPSTFSTSFGARILVIPGTTMIAREICNSLSMVKNLLLFGAGNDLDANKTFPYEEYFYVDGLAGSKDLILNQLTEITDKSKIDFIIFAHDEWIYTFHELEYLGTAKVIKHTSSAIQQASFKSVTYQSLKDVLSTPRVFKSIQEVRDYPIFVKPDRGQGSRGASLIFSNQDALSYAKNGSDFDEEWVVTEYIPGTEVTVDCFSNRRSQVIYSQPRIREEISYGISVSTRLTEDESLSSWAQIISSEFRLSGCWFYQAKQNSQGRWVLLEVGLRIAGASGINRLKGVNLSLMWVYSEAELSVSVIDQEIYPSVDSKGFNLNFIYQDMYVDFDDTLVIRGSANLPLVRFLQKEKESGKAVTVITRSAESVGPVLKTIGLDWLSGNIIYAGKDETKSSFINIGRNFLFIDDSFRERAEVHSVFRSRVTVLDENAFRGFNV